MVETGSYDNAVPVEEVHASIDEVRVYMDDRFRRVPVAKAFSDTRDSIAQCNLERGHVLKVTREGKICCTFCEAEWVEEGY